jgi:two-component system response regulator AtoC
MSLTITTNIQESLPLRCSDGSPPRVLVVDDDPLLAHALEHQLARWGCQTAHAADGETGLELLATSESSGNPFDVMLTDLSLPGISGDEVLARVRSERRAVAVVLMTGYGSVESAVAAVRHGAIDYLTKPLVDEELLHALHRAVQQRALLRENHDLRRRVQGDDLAHVVGTDVRMLRVFEVIRAVAGARTTVLMSGESGTGKSKIAHALHNLSPRRDKPFIELSCGSIPETLLESELFGHVKGAFTGAHVDKAGRFLAADGGTLFLDEINSASPGMQLKLLRVLQERKFEPVGSTQTIEVDVRVVLASNQPLEALVASGQFRQDLYYRINVMKVELPPLRERTSDIPSLASHFLAMHAQDLKRTIVGFSPSAMAALRSYAFPGNIRELSNIVEHAAVLCKGQTIELEDLPEGVLKHKSPIVVTPEGAPAWSLANPLTLEDALKGPEHKIILAALEAHAWNRQRTADVLGVNRTTLYKRMKALGLDVG